MTLISALFKNFDSYFGLSDIAGKTQLCTLS